MGLVHWVVVAMATLKAVGHASMTIEMPRSSFCELDNLDACQAEDCVRYDPHIMKNSPSLITCFAEGRTGNMISAYVSLLWVKWEYNLPVFMEKATKNILQKVFVGLDDFPTLEDNLCNFREFPFRRVDIDFIRDLSKDEYKVGQALVMNIDINRPDLNGWWSMLKQNRRRTVERLKFQPDIADHTDKVLKGIAKKVRNSKTVVFGNKKVAL